MTQPPTGRRELVWWRSLRHNRWAAVGEAVGVFLIVASARAYYVATYSSSVPVWDQWDAEWEGVILPWLRHTLTASALWVPHGEHRVVLTKLSALLLFRLNGTWDPGVEMIVNALFCGALAVWLCVVLCKLLPDAPRLPIIACVVLYETLPFGWGNTLGGFQSAFYYLIGCSLIGICGLTTCHALSARAVLGLVFLVAAVGTMGSGFVAAASVTLVLGYGVLSGQGDSRSVRSWLQLILCGSIAMAGWHLRAPGAALDTRCLEAPATCIASLGQHLAWPMPEVPWLSLLVYLPSMLILVSVLAGDQSPAKSFLSAVTVWVLAQVLAMVIGRQPTDEVPSRYMDVLGIGVVANFAAILLLTTEAPRRYKEVLTLLWIVVVVTGLVRVTARDFLEDLPERGRATQIQETDTRKLVRTGDKAIIRDRPWQQLAYPSHERLWALLSTSETRNALPASVRQPESFTVEGPSGFMQDGAHGWVPREIGTPVWGSFIDDSPSVVGSEEARDARRRAHVGQFRSGTFTPPLPYLRFGLAGNLGDDGLKLVLKQDGRTILVPAPARTPISWRQWHFVDVPVQPGKPTRIVAIDASPTGWFAFSGPFASGPLSHFASVFSDWSISLLGTGLGLLAWLYIPRPGRKRAVAAGIGD